MGPVVKREDLEQIVGQVNGRFEWFTDKIKKLEDKVAQLENANTPTKPTAKEKAA